MEVAPNANPPVCRIMDFGKFKFDEAQRAKESRRKATSSSIKEMKYRPKIGIGDFDTKTRQVGKFLSEGHKVKITIMFRGREMSHPELGKKLLDHVAEQVGAIGKIEAAPKLDGRNMIMVLAPDRRAAQAAAAPRPVPAAPDVATTASAADHDSPPATAAATSSTNSAPTNNAPPNDLPPNDLPPTTSDDAAMANSVSPQPNGRALASPAPTTGAASGVPAATTGAAPAEETS